VSEHPMDGRREYRDGTLVYSDRFGPREFWRGGQQLSCLCDAARGMTCAYHGRAQEHALEDHPGKRARCGRDRRPR